MEYESEITDETPTRKLYNCVLDDIRSREVWQRRQTEWYVMRHEGMRRRNKPWAWASDLHFPMADAQIDKFKPFYFNQLFGTDVVAQFIPKSSDLQPFTSEVAQFFDYKVKQKSNLERELLVTIDRMLMAGMDCLRVGYDTEKGRLDFDSILPEHLIVPDSCEDLQKADRVTVVHHLTKDAFKRDPRYLESAKAEEFLCQIVGRGNTEDGNDSGYEQAKELREGITHTAGKNSDLIIVWEMWEQVENGRWIIHWISPLQPDKPLRASQGNPYKHGLLPIVRFEVEVKDKGHYASRGIPERVAPFQFAATKIWNDKQDYMTLVNRPIFGTDSPIPNTANLTMVPGQIMPFNLRAVTMPEPKISFDQEMQQQRQVAEYVIGMPDFGIGDSRTKNGGDVTATEVKAVGAQSQSGVDLKARMFRLTLGELLRMAWSTLLQYDQDTQYFFANQLRQLPDIALAVEGWQIEPNGSSESWNKAAQFQKGLMYLQILGSMPQVATNIQEVAKFWIEQDNPQLVKRFLIDRDAKAASEYEEEGKNIPTMMLGLQIQPKLEEDQAVRIKACVDFMKAMGALGVPPNPLGIATIQAHIQLSLQMLAQKNPELAQQVAAMVQQAAPPNVIQIPKEQAPPTETGAGA